MAKTKHEYSMVGLSKGVSFPSIDDLIEHVLTYGCDPNNELIIDGEVQDEELVFDLMEL